MPATSQAQFRAMQAAAHGNSTLGIPKKVGQEFAAATPSPSSLPRKAPPMTSSVEVMTGLPSGKKKVRRGGGRHTSKAAQHHKALNAAMQQGDHAAAKNHALSLANALHAMTKAPAGGSAMSPAVPGQDETGL